MIILFYIEEIKNVIREMKLNAEILVINNNSTDNSKQIALDNGVRVVDEVKKGYGATLRKGTNSAKGRFCIMGDADGSYNFTEIDMFLKEIKNGFDLVIGNRYKGNSENKSMKFSHIIGGKMLSNFANLLYKTNIKDYNCGLRVYNTEKFKLISCKADGMEYASEMIIKAKKFNLKMIEVPISLRKDLRDSKSHLRTFRDGFRHLFLMLSFINK